MKLQLILYTALAVALFGSCSGRQRYRLLKLSNCWQSSRNSSHWCWNALDGNTNQTLAGGSCFLASHEATGWWTAETGRPAIFVWIEIYNRQDCCAERLTNLTIFVDDNVCRRYSGRAFYVEKFRCTRSLLGSELTISSSKPDLSLCEVIALGRYAGKKLKLSRCKQSSQFGRDAGWCHKAIDGERWQVYGRGPSCSHAGPEPTGWWRAELDRPALIKYVLIHNRQDCCAERLTNFTISVNDDVCYTHDGTIFSVKIFRCDKAGSVLKISSNKPNLTLCEVTVTGKKLERQLKLSNCWQSSSYSSHSCGKAIDGNTNQTLAGGSCFLASPEATGWWKADTGRPAIFVRIQIYNRLDCCRKRRTKFRVFVDTKLCFRYRGRGFSVRKFSCIGPLLGSELKISSRKPNLSLCEVIALGRYAGKKLEFSRCKQSSQFGPSFGHCHLAIDGETHLLYGCSYAGSEPTGWWRAELDEPALIEYVLIHNRQDCCADRLTNFTISVNDDVCYTHNGTNFSVEVFLCCISGSVLKISSNKPNLTLCEVTATGKRLDSKLKLTGCSQSSELAPGNGSCKEAIDGDTNQNFVPGHRCSHAGRNATGWWQAQVERPAWIKFVEIHNRQDCCADSLTNFTISVDDNVCYTHNGTSFSIMVFRCFKKGTVVKIVSSKPNLTLCEVIVTGRYLDKKLPLSRCNQSSELPRGIGLCQQAIDGSTYQRFEPGHHCSHVGGEATGWWKAETGRPVFIKYVRIYNRKDCCADRLTDFKISVNETDCYTHDGTIFSTKLFRCFAVGLMLKISSNKPNMTLCEVIAIGQYID